MSEINVAECTKKYIELRDAIEAIEKRAKEQAAPLKKAMEVIESALMDQMNRTGTKQLKSEFGTAFIQTVKQCRVTQWEGDTGALPFIIANQQWQLLNKAVNKTAVEEYINQHETPPPGVGWTVLREVQVRRS